MGMGGRHHHLLIPKQQQRGAEKCMGRGMQETTEASEPAAKPSVTGTTTIPIPVPRHVEAREVQGKLPSSGGQETMLLPGLTIVLSSPTMHTPINISHDPISVHSSSQSSHPLAGLTLPQSAHEALAMAHLERMLALVQSAVMEATPSLSFTTQAMQPSAEVAQTMSNEWYRAINNDSWYKYKPD
jgi:hypothetical protein